MAMDNIFISFSKTRAETIGNVFFNLLHDMYASKAHVTVNFAPEFLNRSGGRFEEKILTKLTDVRCGICILTPDNAKDWGDSTWLTFEAGALAIKTAENKGEFLPFLFCLSPDDMPSPLQSWQATGRYFSDHLSNKKFFRDFVGCVNASLGKSNQLTAVEIEDFLNPKWRDYLEDKFKEIATDMQPGASSYGRKFLQSRKNIKISLEGLKTYRQRSISLQRGLHPKTPSEIISHLEKMVKNLPDQWLVQGSEDKENNSHRVILNDTRFSNFVVFTDGARIVLFDREKDRGNTNVFNPLLDVFGAVAFENRTICTKIKSQDFLRSEILRIEEIPGVAVEDNVGKEDPSRRETAVMLGIAVFLSPDNLDLACRDTKNDEIVICDVRQVCFDENALTAKALLGVQYLLKNAEYKTTSED